MSDVDDVQQQKSTAASILMKIQVKKIERDSGGQSQDS